MNRHFLLGPVIIALAFTLPDWRWTAAQIVAGVAYISLGFLKR